MQRETLSAPAGAAARPRDFTAWVLGKLGFSAELGIRGKLIVPFVLIFSISILFLSVVFLRHERAALMNSLNKKAESLAKNLAGSLGDNIAMAEYDVLQKRVDMTKAGDEDVAYAYVVGSDNKAMASTDPALRNASMDKTPFDLAALDATAFTRRATPTPGIFEVDIPVLYAKRRMGLLRVGISTAAVDRLTREGVFTVFSMALLALVLGSLVYAFVARRIAKPLVTVVERLGDLARGEADLTMRLPVTGNDEVGRLASQFNTFLESMSQLVSDIRGASSQISESSQTLSTITQQSSELIGNSVGVMTQISQASAQVATNTHAVANSLQEMGGSAQRGGGLATSVVDKTKDAQQSAASAVTLILELGEASHKIGSIIDVITKITNQTNLLSLNAAIEAARAGQAGQGFTVVADEIRRLADTSAQNAQRISALVKEVQQKTEAAIETTKKASSEAAESHRLTEEASKLFTSIATEVERVNVQMSQVAASTEESAASTQQATATAEEHSASIEQIAIKSQELDRVVSTLTSLVGRFRA